MSFERSLSFAAAEPVAVSLPERYLEQSESVEEEIELETTEGRSLLLQEIEDLALTCDVADDAELFFESRVFALVEELQTALTKIEETMSRGEDVTIKEAQAIQDLYDQLAIEVEQPTIVSVYVPPSRKDMVLEDLSEEGQITITQSKEAIELPMSQTKFIHNSLEEQPKTPSQTTKPKPASQETATLYKVDSLEQALQKQIDQIEAVELSALDAWINEYQSPYNVLGDRPFAELQSLAAAPINSRPYIEFKQLLELNNIKYEVFNQWSQQFAEMEQMVDQASTKSFKEVVDEYLTRRLDRVVHS